MKVHPAALIVPPPTESDYASLRAGIDQHGQREPIVLCDGLILDGRTRWRVCKELALEPVTREFGSRPGDGDDPLAFAVDTNARRRHLNTTQRAKAAANLVDEWGDLRSKRSQIWHLPGEGRQAMAKAGDVFGVGHSTVQMARRLKQEAPDLFDLMDGVTLKLNGATQMMRARANTSPEPEATAKRQRTPTVNPSEDRDAHRSALAALTAANAATVEVHADRDVLDAAVASIKHRDDLVKLAMNVAWSVRYFQRVHNTLQATLTPDEIRRVDSALVESGGKVTAPALRPIVGGRQAG